MNPRHPPAFLLSAPELLHISTAIAALDALEASFHIEHLDIDDSCPDAEPSVVHAAAVLRSTRLLRTRLRRYRRLVKCLLASGRPSDDLPF
jgi:hypothetical protein